MVGGGEGELVTNTIFLFLIGHIFFIHLREPKILQTIFEKKNILSSFCFSRKKSHRGYFQFILTFRDAYTSLATPLNQLSNSCLLLIPPAKSSWRVHLQSNKCCLSAGKKLIERDYLPTVLVSCD